MPAKAVKTIAHPLLRKHAAKVMRDSFKGFNWRRDMWVGALAEFIAICVQSLWQLSDDPVTLALTYVAPLFS